MVAFIALCLLPALLFFLGFAALSPYDNWVRRTGGWARERIDPLWRRVHPPPPPDPFEVLSVQVRLERLAAEIHELEHDHGRWARAHHLRAAIAAYDDLLDEACRMAGAPPSAEEDPRPVRRVLEEAELRSRGWL